VALFPAQRSERRVRARDTPSRVRRAEARRESVLRTIAKTGRVCTHCGVGWVSVRLCAGLSCSRQRLQRYCWAGGSEQRTLRRVWLHIPSLGVPPFSPRRGGSVPSEPSLADSSLVLGRWIPFTTNVQWHRMTCNVNGLYRRRGNSRRLSTLFYGLRRRGQHPAARSPHGTSLG
jgi:hypothetical protein